MRYKYLTEKHLKELNEIWSDHGEAITALTHECIIASMHGFRRSIVWGSCVASVATVLGGSLSFLVYQRINNNKKKL